MIPHTTLGNGFAASRQLKQLIDQRIIQLAGNKKLRIYGTLDCFSGKRMRKENRVFFGSEKEAIESGYRCCKHCWCKTQRAR
ncbi:MAG TPA: Ada metal-binding domain-containing protein [Chitinophagaceae bacterium]|nr:Ada metal-binding domain-containing protein [Chitinophagaceae bacterium]